jgi:hypothetical protein
MQPNTLRNVICAGVLLIHGARQARALQSAPQSYDAKVIAGEVLKQSGLHLPAGVSDLVEFSAMQDVQTACESINVEWTSLPDSRKFAPEEDADGPDFVETLEFQSRQSFPMCDPKAYRASPASFPFFGFVVFGVSRSGIIRGLQMESDPRVWTFDCLLLPGMAPDPAGHCGRFVQQKGTVDVRLPRDPEITRLVFFVRKQDSPPGYWHIVRVGSVELPSKAPINKSAESSNSPGPE